MASKDPVTKGDVAKVSLIVVGIGIVLAVLAHLVSSFCFDHC